MAITLSNVIKISVFGLLIATGVALAEPDNLSNSLEDLRDEFSAKERAVTEEWDRRAKEPGVDQQALAREMKGRHKALRESYSKRDPRIVQLKDVNEELGKLDNGGMRLESTGGSPKLEPKHVNADVDAKLSNLDGSKATPQRINQGLGVLKDDAKQRGQRVQENAARVDLPDSDVTGWKAGSAEGRAANANDFDANVTPGGLYDTRNPGGLRDEAGANKDLRSKYEKARVDGDLKTQAKAASKVASNEANTRPRVVDGPDGPTFDLQKGVDDKGNVTYSIPRDPKPGTDQALIDKANVLKNDYGTTHEAGVTTPGAGKQVNQMEVESFQNDLDTHMDTMEQRATAKGQLRETIRENFAGSYDNASQTGSGDAGNRPTFNEQTGAPELRPGGPQIRNEIDRINRGNAVADDKINQNKPKPSATETYTAGRKPKPDVGSPTLDGPELQTSLDSAATNSAATSNNPPADLSGTPQINDTGLNSAAVNNVDAGDAITLQSETPRRSQSRPQPLTEGKSSFSAPTARDKLNNLPGNLDDAVEGAVGRFTGDELDRSDASSDVGGKAATALSAGVVAGSAYVAAQNRAEANKATAAADKANENYDAALENNNFDEAFRQNNVEFANRNKADKKNDAAFGGAVGAGGGALELLDGALQTPAAGLAAVGQSAAAAMDGFQTGNAIGKAEIARQRAARASAHAANLRARGLDKQAEKYEQIAAQSNEELLTEAETAAGGAIKTGVGIAAAAGSTAAGAGLGAYTLSRLAIENTRPGKALEEGKANLGARFLEWWNGAPEKEQEAKARAQTIATLQAGLQDGTYVVMDDIDKGDIDKIIDTANRTGDFTHITTILRRPEPRKPTAAIPDTPRSAPAAETTAQTDVVDGSNDVSDEDWDAEFDEFWESLDEEDYLDSESYEDVDTVAEAGNSDDQRTAQPRYDDSAMLAALGTNVNDDLYGAAQSSNGDSASARDSTAFERSAAEQSEHDGQMAGIDQQGRATESAIDQAQSEHAGSMNELESKLDRKAAARDAIGAGLSSGLQDGIYVAGRRLGNAAGNTIVEPEDKGGCGGCGGGGGRHDGDGHGHHDNSGNRSQGGGARSGMSGGHASGGSGSTPACDRADRMIDEIFDLQRRFINSKGNGVASLKARHDKLVNDINRPLNQCIRESRSRGMALFQRLQNSPINSLARSQ